MKKILISLFLALPLCFQLQIVVAQSTANFERVEPAFWWTGMKNNELQILFYNSKIDISKYEVSVKNGNIILLEKIAVQNPHYLFLRVQISPKAIAGKVPIRFSSKGKTFDFMYEIKSKSQDRNRIKGFDASDVVYLIMPDRFANANPKNDSIAGFYEGTHREKLFGRHGGDIQGIVEHLEYIEELGVTTLWLNPVLENNQKKESYHGYAITDLYKVDARFGTNDEYLRLIDKAHSMGMKIVQDMVINHIGNFHWMVTDPPENNWIHQFPEFTRSNYRGQLISDPYRSKYDSIRMVNGWFDYTMPDVNQSNSMFAQYLIQNSIWWIEYAGIDGIRMDTYPYPDKYFMARWAKAVTDEYPQFGIVGEVWLQNSIPATAYWQKGIKNIDGYDSNLPSVTDFPFCFAVPKALSEGAGWDTGMSRLYELLSQDFLYPNPNHNLTFLDNHDMTRFYRAVGMDLNKFKMGLTFLFTTRGIPQIYYGTEVLMDGDGSVHPQVRMDYPGGWAGDSLDYFEGKGLTSNQIEATNFLKKILNWRKSKPVIHNGTLKHFIPENNVYVYFRTLNREVVMVIINANDTETSLTTTRFEEVMKGKTKFKNVMTDEVGDNLQTIKIQANTAMVLELE